MAKGQAAITAPGGRKRGQSFTSHGHGLLSRWNATEGREVYYVQVYYEGRRYTEAAGTLNQAQRRLGKRLEEVREGTYLPPRARRAAKRAALVRQRSLAFDEASERFLKHVEKHTGYHAAHKGLFKRLGVWFGKSRLDEITRHDVHQFLQDRTKNLGPYKKWPRSIGLRTAYGELTGLSGLYGFLQDVEGFDLVNPCHRPRSRKYAAAEFGAYRPLREKRIPTGVELARIFELAGTVTYQEPDEKGVQRRTGSKFARLPKEQREAARAVFSAAVKACYFLAARPESELCQLQHGDVDLPDRDKVRSLKKGEEVLGSVTFRETKTGVDRTLPLHPEAEEALRAIMLERPKGERGLDAWRATPIFRSVDGTAWDRHSYRKPWKALMVAVAAEFPRLSGMVLRDLRTAASTTMRAAGVDGAIAAKILGHSEAMNASAYTVATDETSRRAILSLLPSATQPAEVAVGVAVKPV